MRRSGLFLAAIAVVVVTAVGYRLYQRWRAPIGRISLLRRYWSDPEAHSDWILHAGDRCGDAPFIFPTNGFVGFLWGDSFRPGHRHQGVDIFGPTGPDGLGETPVLAAYDGYLTRLSDWKSSVIIRIPDDPLHPGRQIWIYYTHMADAEGRSFISDSFPSGTIEAFVPAGTLLGYQGNYSADPDNPTGMHLHFSIVKDDGRGQFRNELKFSNTLDPSPYLGLVLKADLAGDDPVTCQEQVAPLEEERQR
jgi:murein DD-endopeptidase MepM/ murein hydrolase activator NlpD